MVSSKIMKKRHRVSEWSKERKIHTKKKKEGKKDNDTLVLDVELLCNEFIVFI